jgi:hypothetical protein
LKAWATATIGDPVIVNIAMISEHASPLATLGGVDAGGQNIESVIADTTVLPVRETSWP